MTKSFPPKIAPLKSVRSVIYRDIIPLSVSCIMQDVLMCMRKKSPIKHMARQCEKENDSGEWNEKERNGYTNNDDLCKYVLWITFAGIGLD